MSYILAKWIPRKNIAKCDLDKTLNLRWRYECSKCNRMVLNKSNICPCCKSFMWL